MRRRLVAYEYMGYGRGIFWVLSPLQTDAPLLTLNTLTSFLRFNAFCNLSVHRRLYAKSKRFEWYHYGGTWRTMHCCLCINCYGSGREGRGVQQHPSPSAHTFTSRFLTINAKTTVHCPPCSSMAPVSPPSFLAYHTFNIGYYFVKKEKINCPKYVGRELGSIKESTAASLG